MANLLIFERALDANGYTAPGAKATVYLTGTTTLISVYSDKDGTIPASNPIVADGIGVWPQRYVTEVAKVVFTDASDATLPPGTLDPCPTVAGTGSAASSVSFDPTVEVPENNVQAAIESVAATVIGGLTAYGIGVTGNTTLLANIDATGTASGVYRWDGASTGTFPAGITAATTGLIDFDRQTAAEGMMTLRALGQTRTYVRFLSSTAWGAWREVPSFTDPGGQRLIGWDDTANAFAYFSAGTGISLASNTIAATVGYGSAAAVALSGSSTPAITTAIPSAAGQVNVGFTGVSTNGTAAWGFRVGAGSVLSTGYEADAYMGTIGGTNSTVRFPMLHVSGVTNTYRGSAILTRMAGDVWFMQGLTFRDDGISWTSQGTITVAGGINRLSFSAGSDTFDAGTAYVSWM